VTELLQNVRALNPVPTCARPSIEDVWSKLERGDTTTVDADERTPTRRGTPADVVAGRGQLDRQRVRRPALSWRGLGVSAAVAVIVAAAVLVGVGGRAGTRRVPSAQHVAVSAAVRRLADGTISCYFASSRAAGGPDVGPVAVSRRSAVVFCRDQYRASARAGADASQTTFIVCQTSATNVAVYIADGHPNQCHRLGDRALPAGYAAAVQQARSRAATISAAARTSSESV